MSARVDRSGRFEEIATQSANDPNRSLSAMSCALGGTENQDFAYPAPAGLSLRLCATLRKPLLFPIADTALDTPEWPDWGR